MEESQGILNTNMERKARVSSWVSINPKACGMINEDLKQLDSDSKEVHSF